MVTGWQDNGMTLWSKGRQDGRSEADNLGNTLHSLPMSPTLIPDRSGTELERVLEPSASPHPLTPPHNTNRDRHHQCQSRQICAEATVCQDCRDTDLFRGIRECNGAWEPEKTKDVAIIPCRLPQLKYRAPGLL